MRRPGGKKKKEGKEKSRSTVHRDSGVSFTRVGGKRTQREGKSGSGLAIGKSGGKGDGRSGGKVRLCLLISHLLSNVEELGVDRKGDRRERGGKGRSREGEVYVPKDTLSFPLQLPEGRGGSGIPQKKREKKKKKR